MSMTPQIITLITFILVCYSTANSMPENIETIPHIFFLYESLGIQTGGVPVETQDLASLQLSCFVVLVRAWLLYETAWESPLRCSFVP